MKSFRILAGLVGAMGLAVSAAGAAGRTARLALASEQWLSMSVGKFEPGKGWVQSEDFYMDAQPEVPFTLYGTSGRLGEARLEAANRPEPYAVPGGWSARIDRQGTRAQPFALAVEGASPDTGEMSVALAADDPSVLQAAAEFLKARGVRVDHPLITEAFQVDLNGDGSPETLLCAHSDMSALRDELEAAVYAVCLVQFKRNGKLQTLPLVAQASWKPAGRTIDEHEHLYGKREFNRLLAFHDIDGDGRREVAVYRSRYGASQVDVFTFDGRRLRRVLSSYKYTFN